jgi:DNA processing protein
LTSDASLALALLMEERSRARVRALVGEHGDPVRALRSVGRGARHRIDDLRRVLERLDARAIAQFEPGFPGRLAAIPDPPLVLSLQGDSACFGAPGVAIVGARRASVMGLQTARTLARSLAELGIVVVSGLALGIDGAAHAGALDSAKPHSTIAVLGSGIGAVQPMTNLPLARSILSAGGLIVSEYSPFSAANRYRFPERNRLISGLADVVVVVEASERSGSLITARLAAEQGREVLAVPGAVGAPNSKGVNMLLKQGAGLADCVDDVLDALGYQPARPVTCGGVSPDLLSAPAARVLESFREVASTLDQVCADTGLTAAAASAALAELELAGIVSRAGGGYIRRPV